MDCLARALTRVAPADEVIRLTRREAAVAYRTIVLDESAGEIAAALDRSVGAVEAHRTTLYAKLGLSTSTSAGRCRVHVVLVAYGRELERHGCDVFAALTPEEADVLWRDVIEWPPTPQASAQERRGCEAAR